ncbi:MAG: PLDc N-terminal domain-containing protein [Daejeonella sp.]|uniref:PLDc N-terminal domain-containing protein n=1 Tax=Daejeonella sp. JGW-45 TaxID=3034148 RepID=UPI0023EB6FE8|nr:PLDc N-terminal domain-containing protein [Daejeonella sp. JGW-45]
MLCAISLEFGPSEIAMVIFAILILLVLVPFTIIDSLRSPNLTPIQKFAWIVFIIIAPYLGAIAYLLWGRKQKMV